MKEQIIIEQFNYFGDSSDRNFNAKVLYRKRGKSYLAYVSVDFFNKRVYIPRQSKECKILSGFEYAINQNQFKKDITS
jgi:hypothetical protein